MVRSFFQVMGEQAAMWLPIEFIVIFQVVCCQTALLLPIGFIVTCFSGYGLLDVSVAVVMMSILNTLSLFNCVNGKPECKCTYHADICDSQN